MLLLPSICSNIDNPCFRERKSSYFLNCHVSVNNQKEILANEDAS